jgi:hypothetical protein
MLALRTGLGLTRTGADGALNAGGAAAGGYHVAAGAGGYGEVGIPGGGYGDVGIPGVRYGVDPLATGGGTGRYWCPG